MDDAVGTTVIKNYISFLWPFKINIWDRKHLSVAFSSFIFVEMTETKTCVSPMAINLNCRHNYYQNVKMLDLLYICEMEAFFGFGLAMLILLRFIPLLQLDFFRYVLIHVPKPKIHTNTASIYNSVKLLLLHMQKSVDFYGLSRMEYLIRRN